MTIAIGMVYDFGVLLCADTQHETYSLKTHGPKLGSFTCGEWKIVYAMAGHGPFAKSAIQKCQRTLQASGTESIPETIEGVLEEEYQRNVFRHPSQATDHSLQYWFLLSLWSPNAGLKLYSTWQTSMVEVEENECIGVGQDVANCIIKPSYYPRMAEREALMLSTYALAQAKVFVPGCGGHSQVLLMRNDGKIEQPSGIQRQEKRLSDCDSAMRTLLLKATDLDIEDLSLKGALRHLAVRFAS